MVGQEAWTRGMTAEMAVLNRLAVALAADSAVTIGRDESTKIFQSENKLFKLSSRKPIGLLIYNDNEFFGVPWKLIVKDFRLENGDDSRQTVFDWFTDF
jgi:hypothetical protein